MGELNTNRGLDREYELNPSDVGIFTMTFYPDLIGANGVRAKLAVDMLRRASMQGYSVVIADGGSCNEFVKSIVNIDKVRIINPQEKGMSASRRAGLLEAANTSAKVIMWNEPEKSPVIGDSILKASQLIVNGDADIVIPGRSVDGFNSLPPEQKTAEEKLNKGFRRILRQFGHVENVPEIDISFGPKLFRNSPQILDIFSHIYEYQPTGKKWDRKVNPERWANSLYIPVAEAIINGMKVVPFVFSDYIHPAEQTKIETGDLFFARKRIEQFQDVLRSVVNYVKLRNGSGSKLRKI
jgi:hypothetical protein